MNSSAGLSAFAASLGEPLHGGSPTSPFWSESSLRRAAWRGSPAGFRRGAPSASLPRSRYDPNENITPDVPPARVHVTAHSATDDIVGVLSEAHRRSRRRRFEMRSSLQRHGPAPLSDLRRPELEWLARRASLSPVGTNWVNGSGGSMSFVALPKACSTARRIHRAVTAATKRSIAWTRSAPRARLRTTPVSTRSTPGTRSAR